jgi:hypothetical protein
MLYRSKLPLMVLARGDNHDAAVAIPQGATFRVLGPDRDDRFMVVHFRREDFLVFASDLYNLCEAVSSGRYPRGDSTAIRALTA